MLCSVAYGIGSMLVPTVKSFQSTRPHPSLIHGFHTVTWLGPDTDSICWFLTKMENGPYFSSLETHGQDIYSFLHYYPQHFQVNKYENKDMFCNEASESWSHDASVNFVDWTSIINQSCFVEAGFDEALQWLPTSNRLWFQNSISIHFSCRIYFLGGVGEEFK